MADEINMTTAPVEPPPAYIPQTPVTPPAETKKTGISKVLIAIFIVVFIFLAGLVITSKYVSPISSKVKPTTTLAPRPTPTPERQLSPVATQSAFMALNVHVASLSAGINNFILDDPQLTPPVLDLPLGF